MKFTFKALRVNKDMSQVEASSALGISKKTLQNWEAYTTYPNAIQLLKICEVYECSLGDIFLPDKLAKSEEVEE